MNNSKLLKCPNEFCAQRSINSKTCGISGATKIYCYYRKNYIRQLIQSPKGNNMSRPIVQCRYLKALTDEQAFNRLVEDVKYNIEKGVMSVWPCEHTPKCRDLTEQEVDELAEKMSAALYELQ